MVGTRTRQVNFTVRLLDVWLEASNRSRRQLIQEYGLLPLVYVPRLPFALQPVSGLLYVLIFTLTLVGNTAVLLLLCQRKALQSPSTFLICSLVLSDFLHKLIPFLQVPATATSILTMACIAVERFHGILYPLKLRSDCSPCHATKRFDEKERSPQLKAWCCRRNHRSIRPPGALSSILGPIKGCNTEPL
ncbi:hypothetical protein AAFF_G00012930 [Aldrovandia affinis]|uniref:G-protein coupled receptors family 1 profile domain-containing protein n=1 Tax=Aldrovandia affinis TaxID=143900 RepID=A0AAD7S6M3_9TELE|nr:hypothetical protein AAFF_G00012930 [Aldrovandia affinis]